MPTTTRPTKLIIDCSTNEQVEVELSDEEIAQLEADRAAFEAQRAVEEAEAAAKAAAKESARAKLAALGLSDEELAALVG